MAAGTACGVQLSLAGMCEWGDVMFLRFINYSCRPLTVLCSHLQDGCDSRWTKPNGLWLSVVDEDGKDSWKELCKVKSIRLKPYATEIVLKPDARILWLCDAGAIDRLTTAYGFFPECHDLLKEDPNYTRSAVRWDYVAEQYDAAITTPYCNDRHREEHWYFTWECRLVVPGTLTLWQSTSRVIKACSTA
jgi:hypothetical protein